MRYQCIASMHRMHASHTSESDASHHAVGDATDGRTNERDVDITHPASRSSVSVRARQRLNVHGLKCAGASRPAGRSGGGSIVRCSNCGRLVIWGQTCVCGQVVQ